MNTSPFEMPIPDGTIEVIPSTKKKGAPHFTEPATPVPVIKTAGGIPEFPNTLEPTTEIAENPSE